MIQSTELVVRELTEIVTNKGSNIPRLCRVGECEECEKEKKCDCECENCKEVRIRHEMDLHTCIVVYLHICTFVYLPSKYVSSTSQAGVEMLE